MTVCIGLRCSDKDGKPGNAIVLCADRLITFEQAGVEFPNQTKIKPIASYCAAGGAGTLPFYNEIFCKVAEVAAKANPPLPIRALADGAAFHYKELRVRVLKNFIFDSRGLDFDKYYEGIQQQLAYHIAKDIDKQVSEFDPKSEIIIAGVDQTGAQLYRVANPGGLAISPAPLNHLTIGDGGTLAMLSLMELGYKECSLGEAILAAYFAKRRAERINSVGPLTDIWLIQADGTTVLTENEIGTLKGFFDRYEDKARSSLEEITAEWIKIITATPPIPPTTSIKPLPPSETK